MGSQKYEILLSGGWESSQFQEQWRVLRILYNVIHKNTTREAKKPKIGKYCIWERQGTVMDTCHLVKDIQIFKGINIKVIWKKIFKCIERQQYRMVKW